MNKEEGPLKEINMKWSRNHGENEASHLFGMSPIDKSVDLVSTKPNTYSGGRKPRSVSERLQGDKRQRTDDDSEQYQ